MLFSDNFNDGQFLDGDWQIPDQIPPRGYPSASTGRLCGGPVLGSDPTPGYLLFTNRTFNKSVRVEADTLLPPGYEGAFGFGLNAREDTVAPHSNYGIGGVVVSSPSLPSPVAFLFTLVGSQLVNNTSAFLSALPSRLALEDASGTLNFYADGSRILSLPNEIPPVFSIEAPLPTPSPPTKASVSDSVVNVSTEGGRIGLVAFLDPITNSLGPPMCFDNVVVSCVAGTCPTASNPVNPDQLKAAPGFDAVFAVMGLVVVAHLFNRRSRKSGRLRPPGGGQQ